MAIEITGHVKEMVAQANSKIVTIDLAEAQTLLADENTLFCDIRDVRELWREGTIPGAKHVPRGMLEFWVDPQSPYHKPELIDGRRLLLFCASAWRSALAAQTLQDMGHTHVAHLEGGFKAWAKSEFPIQTVEKR